MERLKNLAVDSWRRFLTARCAICQQSVGDGRICRPCRRILPWNDVHCECCGQPLNARQPDAVFCEACQAKRPPFEKARAPLKYDFPADAIIKAIKFKRQLAYVPACTELLLQTLRREFTHVDALLPVPLHRRRQMRRGFNQAMELCRPLHKATGLPVCMQVRRNRATIAQTGLSAAERRKNLKGAFTVAGRSAYRHPLIIDDVMTTGETCSQLAIALLDAGATAVSVLTVARASVNRR